MSPVSERPAPRPTPAPVTNWPRRLVVVFLVIAVFLVLAFVGASFLPRWWAHRVGDQVQGSIAAGILFGLAYGFVFTLLPLALLLLAAGRLRSRRLWLGALALAALLATPNLLTLGIVLGTGNGAHAGDRTLDVQAPAFRGASLAGALLAVGMLAFVVYLVVTRRHARGRLRRLQDASRRAASPPGTDTRG